MQVRKFISVGFILSASISMAGEIGVMQFPAGEVQHVVRSDYTLWKPCPPTLPAGCEMAVLDGNSQVADMLTVRFKASDVFRMPPHWHPKDERVTVISGKAGVAFGAEATRDDATWFGPGDYYVNARHAVHQVWIEGSTVLQITGTGPWKAGLEIDDQVGRDAAHRGSDRSRYSNSPSCILTARLSAPGFPS